jgi:hypothetical protein
MVPTTARFGRGAGSPWHLNHGLPPRRVCLRDANDFVRRPPREVVATGEAYETKAAAVLVMLESPYRLVLPCQRSRMASSAARCIGLTSSPT